MATPYSTGGERLQPLFTTLQNWGFSDFVLPTILIFAVLFAILQKIAIFGKKVGEGPAEKRVGDRKLNGLLAFIISLLIVIPHVLQLYPRDMDPIFIIGQFLPNSIILLAAILVAMMLIGFTSGENQPKPANLYIGLIAVIALLAIIVKAAFPAFAPQWNADPNTQALLIVILTMAVVGWWIMRPSKPTTPTPKAHKWIREIMGHKENQ